MKKWFSIEARTEGAKGAENNVAKVSIHDVIGWGVTVKDFAAELRALGDVARIDLSIHSPGGSVTDGWAIYNILKAHPAPVHARVEGLAASMASVILMAADEIAMPANAYVMIHNPHVSGLEAADLRDIAEDVVEELTTTAELLDKMRVGIVGAYAARTGLDEEAIGKMMDKGTWIDGKEAADLGFADVVEDDVAAAACLPGWAELVALPAGVEIEKTTEKKRGIIARLLGDDQPQAAAAEADALRAQLTTAREEIDQLKAAGASGALELAEALASVDRLTQELAAARVDADAFNSRLGDAVRARLVEIGVPMDQLPPMAEGDMPEPETVDSIIEKLKACDEPKERWVLAGRLQALRKVSPI